MTPRERNLAITLIGLLAAAAVFGGFMLIYRPIQAKKAQAAQLRTDIDAAQDKAGRLRIGVEAKGAKTADGEPLMPLAEARKKSLPTNPEAARREYKAVLDYLIRDVARIPPPFTINELRADPKGIPSLPGANNKPGGPAFAKVVYEVEFKKADMWAVHDFLMGYYQLDLLHQITALSITREGDARNKVKSTGRNDLTVKFTTEALIIDGTGRRRPLLFVSPGFAAVGGMAGFDAVSVYRNLGRPPAAPVLASPARNYGMLAIQDIFHGPFGDFHIAKLAEVSARPGDPIRSIPLLFNNPPMLNRITITATSNGKLLPPGSVRIGTVDLPGKTAGSGPPQKTVGLSVVPAKGESGTSEVTVVATTRDGRQDKTTLKVTVAQPGPLVIGRIETVYARPGDEIPPVRVSLAGQNAARGKITITATGDEFLAEGVKYDPETEKITITPEEGEIGTATVTVVARAENGDEAKGTFRVTVESSKKAKPDIADSIRLVIASTRSDGTATATIKDSFNPLIYEIEADADEVKVKKYEFFGALKKEDKTYRDAGTPFAKLLTISDDGVSVTDRTFRIVAIDNDGLVLQDLKPPAALKVADPRPGAKGPPAPGAKPPTRKEPTAEPLAAVTGTAALAIRPPVLYRWLAGKALDSLIVIPPEESKKILQRAAAKGPVGAAVVAATDPRN